MTAISETVPPDLSGGPNYERVTVIQPKSPWHVIDFKELREYSDLFYFLVWRDVKVLYAQTILGFSWALLQPLIQILIFSVIFGSVAKVATDGIPYILYTTVAVIPWTYMSVAMGQSCESLILGQSMLGKVYFPRFMFPLTPVLARLIDFVISILILVAVLIYYRVAPTWNLLFFPLLSVLMISVTAGLGMWTSAMAIRFRDVKHAMPFLLRMLIYTAPIVYSASAIPEKYRILYCLNPIVGVIEGFRACLLGTPMPWLSVEIGMGTTLLLLVSGALYFKSMERVFVDVI
jgi:lipopolysaccharide transport system permease protein